MAERQIKSCEVCTPPEAQIPFDWILDRITGAARPMAMLMTGHKTRSVFERYNIVSPGDLLEAARKLNEAPGTVPGTVAPITVTSTVPTSPNLLESNDGPVAQQDRAAVS